MTATPIIGITTHGLNEKGSFHIPATYTHCIRRAGGIPVLIPPGETRLTELVDLIDGFILTGGGDIDPVLYGGNHHESVYGVDQARDQMELALARIILQQKIPTLAICRGLQIFIVALGGTLKDDIGSQAAGAVVHRLPEFKPAMHPIVVKNPSRLGEVLGTKNLICASVHHQAADKLPEGVRISAIAADGVIEGLEFENYDNLIAVQWHPEITAGHDPNQQRLFETLIEKAHQYNHKRRKTCV
jgi:putative glutamine amidotransferase